MLHLPFAKSARCGQAYRFKNLVVYACEGLIVVQDERPGEDGKGDFVVMTPKDMMRHIRANARGVKGWNASNRSWQQEEYRLVTRACQEFEQACKDATDMGDPSDPAVQAFWARHRPGHKSTVSLRAGNDPGGYPTLPHVPLGKFTGKTVSVDGKATLVPPDVHAKKYQLHHPPRRKPRSGLILDL